MKKTMIVVLLVFLMLGTIACGLDINTIENVDNTGDTDDADNEVAGEMTYKLTDTGQTKSYDADGNEINPSQNDVFYGQDADYQGTQPSFTDNGDGTITDNVTGLIWQKVPVSKNFSYDEAIAYSESLVLGANDDWRLPTAKELFGLSDFSEGWPFLDQNYFDFPEASGPPMGGNRDSGPQGGGPQNDTPPMSEPGEEGSIGKDQGQFWTSNFYEIGTTHNGAPSAFGVNHATGHIKAYPSDVTGPMGKFVRAVRGTDNTVNNFVDNGDGTISDLSTGLMWLKHDNGNGVEWQEALAYSEALEFAGYDDWRLPDVKELQSIVDYSGTYPAINADYFSCTELTENENYYFWTSTSAYFSPMEPGYFYAWYVAFGYAVDNQGNDTHGAGAVRFSAKYASSGAGQEGGDNFYNSVRAVRTISE